MSDEFDPALRRAFAPPDLSGLEARVAQAAAERAHDVVASTDGADVVSVCAEPPPKPSSNARWLWVGGVAAAAAALVFVLSGDSPPPPAAPSPAVAPPQPPPTVAVADARREAGAHLAAFYRDGLALPAIPGGNCLGPEPPTAACDSEGAPQWVPSDAIELRGECGSPGRPSCEGTGILAPRALQLRVRPGGPDLLVCVEPTERDPAPVLPDDTELHIFRRELGAYVLYEITPLDEPRALPGFSL